MNCRTRTSLISFWLSYVVITDWNQRPPAFKSINLSWPGLNKVRVSTVTFEKWMEEEPKKGWKMVIIITIVNGIQKYVQGIKSSKCSSLFLLCDIMSIWADIWAYISIMYIVHRHPCKMTVPPIHLARSFSLLLIYNFSPVCFIMPISWRSMNQMRPPSESWSPSAGGTSRPTVDEGKPRRIQPKTPSFVPVGEKAEEAKWRGDC